MPVGYTTIVAAPGIHPCKNMKHLEGKTCPLIIGAGGKLIDAVAEVEKLTRRRQHSPMSTQHLRMRYFEGFDKVGQRNGVPAYSACFGT